MIHRGYGDDEENWRDESLAEIGRCLFDPLAEHVASFVANPDVSITLSNPAGSYGRAPSWARTSSKSTAATR